MRRHHFVRTLGILTAILVFPSCAGWRTQSDTSSQEDHSAAKDPKDRIENLTTALSRAQSRIEELDAKLSALSDKVESTRLTVDNITGSSKTIKTESVGSARADKEEMPSSEAKAETMESSHAHSKVDAATEDFTKAMALFKSGNYSEAELSFNHFTEKYPEHILAGSAQFYSGESYFLMGEYKLALNEYGKVISSFSSSPRVSTAMVRLAQCYEATGNSSESTKVMALARDLYVGNPSLDLPMPSISKKAEGKKELSAGPMDEPPAEHAHEHDEKKSATGKGGH